MAKNKPIHLDFEHLRDFVYDGYVKNPLNAFISKNFAVVLSFKSVAGRVLTLGQPYRLEELRVGLVTAGSAKITINLIDYEFSKDMIMFVSGGSIIQPNSFSPDFDMSAMSVSDELLQLLFNGRVPSSFLGDYQRNKMDISSAEAGIFSSLIDLLWSVVHQKDYCVGVAQGILTSLLYFYDDVNRRDRSDMVSDDSHSHEVFIHFINLVHKNSRKERKISFYADKMCLSQHYLCTLIREASGSTAKEWIERSVINEAKVLLKHSDKLTYQISDELNFPNTSFFCKFFKRITGMTPQQYQNS